jgi:hypothetical protein
MYSGVCLLEAGHALEKAAPEGPDHKAVMNGRRVWVECIAPMAGEGENLAESTIQSWTKTETGGHGRFQPPPDDKIQARLTGALSNKVQQHRRWVEKSVVSADDPFIVAIGAGIIPDTDLVPDPPHVVRALFGVGGPTLTYEIGSDKEAELVPTYCDEIQRVAKTASGDKNAPISLRGFLDETLYPEASAVIFCSQGVWNPPRKIGRDLLTVYNRVAKHSLPPGTISLGQEYWAEYVLRYRDNRESLPELELDEETKRAIDAVVAKRRDHGGAMRWGVVPTRRSPTDRLVSSAGRSSLRWRKRERSAAGTRRAASRRPRAFLGIGRSGAGSGTPSTVPASTLAR